MIMASHGLGHIEQSDKCIFYPAMPLHNEPTTESIKKTGESESYRSFSTNNPALDKVTMAEGTAGNAGQVPTSEGLLLLFRPVRERILKG